MFGIYAGNMVSKGLILQRTKTNETKSSPINICLWALLISALFHLAVFNIFLFHFPVLQESMRPQFIFLGSILKFRDVNVFLQQEHFPSYHVALQQKTYLPPVPSSHSTNEIQLKKPMTLNGYKKITPKSTFKTFLIKRNAHHNPPPEGIGIDTEEKFYNPLSIYSNDQN